VNGKKLAYTFHDSGKNRPPGSVGAIRAGLGGGSPDVVEERLAAIPGPIGVIGAAIVMVKKAYVVEPYGRPSGDSAKATSPWAPTDWAEPPIGAERSAPTQSAKSDTLGPLLWKVGGANAPAK
jgi:hypothetical protein